MQETKDSTTPGDAPPPYEEWMGIGFTPGDLPPPPQSGFLYSNTGNASSEMAEAAHAFCEQTPLWTPGRPSSSLYQSVQECNFPLRHPPEYSGILTALRPGLWRGRSRDGCNDCTITTALPLYFATVDSPAVSGRPRITYFEVKLLALYGKTRPGSDDACGFSIGFVAQPYPTWRSPGWERGSLGVFSDDGCRFVNDSFGGKPFTTSFQRGETIGLGIRFEGPRTTTATNQSHRSVLPVYQTRVFLTRDGREVGSWDLHEEVDQDAGGVEGLEGNFDLYGAIGIFGGVEFQVCFDQSHFLWRSNL